MGIPVDFGDVISFVDVLQTRGYGHSEEETRSPSLRGLPVEFFSEFL
jgi:hypothetical protein